MPHSRHSSPPAATVLFQAESRRSFPGSICPRCATRCREQMQRTILSNPTMVDQRVAAEKAKRRRDTLISPTTRRLKCRIDPEQSPYTCVLSEHKPVRRGREIIGLLAVEEPKPKPAKIRAVSYEAAIDQLFKRIPSSRSALTQQAVSTPRRPVPNERRRRRPPHGRRTGTAGEWPPATRGSPPERK